MIRAGAAPARSAFVVGPATTVRGETAPDETAPDETRRR